MATIEAFPGDRRIALEEERAAEQWRYQAVNDALIGYVSMDGATTARAVRNRLNEVAELCDLVDSIVKHPDVWNVEWREMPGGVDAQFAAAKRLFLLTDAPAIAWPTTIYQPVTGSIDATYLPMTITVRREPADGE